MKLYVGNIAYNMTEPELTDLFAASGTVVSAKIVTEYFSGRSKGFAFVEMASRPEGHKAMEELNGKEIMHNALVVNEARPQKKRKGSRRR